MADITCRDCGAPRSRAMNKNTRYCLPCRLLRDAVFLLEWRRDCVAQNSAGEACGRAFVPISRRDPYCDHCAPGTGQLGLCVLCKRDDADLYRPGVPVCSRCVRREAVRPLLIRALQRGQQARRTADPSTPKESP